ncbi:hypothetical protein [Euzebyella saccharophila]|uniref:Uncharacterized protein n=1 Tax=Euzebyella saccharophila TaxID=679664 RepID=A0ABV8JSW7_9FLAO|nr:hypothetical protein [Euzebyella saccharophila]
MSIKNEFTLESSRIKDRNVQLRCLDRNQRDIKQFNEKLASYLSEPKTPLQFQKFTELKNDARELQNENEVILADIRNQVDVSSQSALLLSKHLRRFQEFAKKVVGYLSDVKMERSLGTS